MTTDTFPPWLANGGDAVVRSFVNTHNDMLELVRTGQFQLHQFDDVADKPRLLRELMWRHYIVYWSARHAARATRVPVKTLVECGVCDGLTAYFAMQAVRRESPFRAVLYDAWEGMKAEYLTDSEGGMAGSYSYLALEATKRNLRAFEREATYVKGFIPDSFATSSLPADIVWLHIDLNSALPTTAALETLYDRMAPGAVVLFDDYGWRAYQDTKAAVDAFADRIQGVLLPIPTGQALLFKPA